MEAFHEDHSKYIIYISDKKVAEQVENQV